MNTVQNLASRLQLPALTQLQQTQSSAGSPPSFVDFMQSGVMEVNSMQQDAHANVHELLTGGDVSQAEVMTAVQKADMAFQLLVQVRNKLMSAYEELNAIRV